MAYCNVCGISLEIDFDDEDGEVCAQCKAQTKGRVDCDFFEIIDWDEGTNEVLFAVCTMPSPTWPNCNRCQNKVEYRDTVASIQEADMLGVYKPLPLMHSAAAELLQSDVDVLDINIDHQVRYDEDEGIEVKRLYNIYKSL